MKREDRVVTVLIGDATTEEGVCSESLNFAALKRVPLIFFCENNFYSVQSPLATRQPSRNLTEWAASHGLPAVVADGVNVLAVHEAMKTAVSRARAGDGPTFIEAPVYRLRAHGGAGDDTHTGYRHIAEREHWEAFDPIALHEHFLRNKQLLDDAALGDMERRIANEIADAFEFALSSPNPTEKDLFRHVYAD